MDAYPRSKDRSAGHGIAVDTQSLRAYVSATDRRWKRSAFGDVNQYGPEGVRFYTKIKTVTARWPTKGGAREGSSFVIPTMR